MTNSERRGLAAHPSGRKLQVAFRAEVGFYRALRGQSGRGAPGVLLGLLGALLLGGVLLWRLEGERADRPPVAGGTGENASVPDREGSPLQLPRQPAVPNPVPEPATPPCRLAVRVTATTDGFSGETRVEVRDATGERVAELVLTAADPSTELACSPGEYELVVDHPGPPVLGALPARIVLAPGARGSVQFSLAVLWSLTGHLTDERELGLEDVPITLVRAERAVAEGRTRPGGSFFLPPLPEDDYVLVIGDPLGPLVPRRSLHLDGELGEQELRVPVLLELEVRVLDERNLAVAGAEVEGVGEKGGRIAGVTDANGLLHAALLPPGDYRIFARHPTLGRGNRIFALSAGLTAPLEVQLLTGRPRH